jgi:TIR domain
VTVWLDDFELKIGDSLRRRIDAGLAGSRFGVVILSRSFFRKGWPQYELDGPVTRQVSGEQSLLPIWHDITKDEVVAESPSLADKIAEHCPVHDRGDRQRGGERRASYGSGFACVGRGGGPIASPRAGPPSGRDTALVGQVQQCCVRCNVMDGSADLPGAAHLVLVAGVAHLDPASAVFEAMLEGGLSSSGRGF